MSYHSSIWKYLSVFNEMVREMLNQPPSSQKKVYNYYRIVIIAFAVNLASSRLFLIFSAFL
jgi:hypothetical protein